MYIPILYTIEIYLGSGILSYCKPSTPLKFSDLKNNSTLWGRVKVHHCARSCARTMSLVQWLQREKSCRLPSHMKINYMYIVYEYMYMYMYSCSARLQ